MHWRAMCSNGVITQSGHWWTGTSGLIGGRLWERSGGGKGKRKTCSELWNISFKFKTSDMTHVGGWREPFTNQLLLVPQSLYSS